MAKKSPPSRSKPGKSPVESAGAVLWDESVLLLDEVFRDPKIRHGLSFFRKSEPRRVPLRRNADSRIECYCAKRQRWLRAKPEEVVRQAFLIWATESLSYDIGRIQVEWPVQMGHDIEKERADIVVFADDACTDPYIIFELKKPQSKEGLDQLRSYLRWTGCFFGCWSNGGDFSYQFKDDTAAKKGTPYKFRPIPRLPKLGEDVGDVLKPICFVDLRPIDNMRALIEQMEHDALANAGVNAFDELFKLFFAKLHDELRKPAKPTDPVEFRVPAASADVIYKRFQGLLTKAMERENWGNIFDPGERLKLKGEALKLCAASLEPHSLMRTDLDVVDAAFEYLINPEQKGQKGQYFTPRPVVKMAVKMLNPADEELVIDPACGSCGFLIQTIRHVQKANGWGQTDIYRYANENIYAVDFDDRLKKVAKVMMLIAGDGKANVFSVNSLDTSEWQNSEAAARIGPFSRDVRDGKFHLVLTNPPFAGKMTGRTQLKAFDLHELAASGLIADDDENGDADAESEEDDADTAPRARRKISGMKRDILFLERSLDLLKPGGRMAIVLPQGNLNNLGTRRLRQWTAGRARLLAVVGLHVNTFKPFTGVKTSVVFLQKWGGDAGKPKANYPVFMAVSHKPGKDNSGDYIPKKDAAGNYIDDEGHPVTESGRPAAIDHDLDDIAEQFIEWGKGQGFKFCTRGD